MHTEVNSFKGRVRRLSIGMGIGEMIMGFTAVTDIWAVSFVGVEQLAGYAFAGMLVSLLYGVIAANTSMIYPEYARTRKLNIIFSYGVISLLLTALVNVLVLVNIGSILSITKLSVEARGIVIPVLVYRSLGIYAYLVSSSLCTYLRTSGFDKEASIGRILTAILNIVLDIVAVITGSGVVGVALATAISEIVELVYYNLILLKGGKRYKKEYFTLTKVNTGNYLTSLTHIMLARSMQAILGTILTKLGDLGYAVYNVVYTVNDIICNFVYTYREVVIISYTEFSDKVNNFYVKIQTIFSKLTFMWWLTSCPVTIVIIKLLSASGSIDIDIHILLVLNLTMLYAEQVMQSNMGFCRIFNDYRVSVISEVAGSITMSIVTVTALRYTVNSYIILSVAWATYYSVIFCITFSTLHRKWRSGIGLS